MQELANALERFRQGERSAARTMATTLRLLLGPGQGDQLLYRVAEAKGFDLPPVWLSRLPGNLHIPPGTVEVIAFGPSFYNSAEEAPPTAQPVALSHAVDQRCFGVRDRGSGAVVELTWLEAMTTVANKLAVHADPDIPKVLDQLDGLIVRNFQTAGFAEVLQKVARVVVPRAQAVLDS